MATVDTYVRARIDTAPKERAADALEAMAELESGKGKRLILGISVKRVGNRSRKL